METKAYSLAEVYLSHEHTAEKCVFCDIIRGQSEASIITRDDAKGVLALMDLQGYPLVLPVKHISNSSTDLEENIETLAAMNELAFRLVTKLQPIFQNDGANVITNIGESAGQEIPHIHTHVIPRYDNDKLFRLPRGQNHPREELDRKASLIRISLTPPITK